MGHDSDPPRPRQRARARLFVAAVLAFLCAGVAQLEPAPASAAAPIVAQLDDSAAAHETTRGRVRVATIVGRLLAVLRRPLATTSGTAAAHAPAAGLADPPTWLGAPPPAWRGPPLTC